jgi:peptidoglycan endopeptidase LytE
LKRLFTAVVLSCAVWGTAALLAAPHAEAHPAEFGVKVQVNDSLVSFPEAAPYIDGKGDMQMPLRPVAEKLGYRIEWTVSGTEAEVTLQSSDRTMKLRTGSGQAEVNGKPAALTTPAQFKDGRVFVPVRFVSESLGYKVQWDDHNGIAIICQDGKFHAPAWWAPAPPQKTPAPVPAAKVIDAAAKYVGVRYAWGGTTPAGFDCSGFVSYVFGQQGVELPRTSREMLDSAGSDVKESALKPGDLVFFGIGKATTHVGIYIGNDSFISATSSHGIHVDSLDSGYWGARYIGAKRIM